MTDFMSVDAFMSEDDFMSVGASAPPSRPLRIFLSFILSFFHSFILSFFLSLSALSLDSLPL